MRPAVPPAVRPAIPCSGSIRPWRAGSPGGSPTARPHPGPGRAHRLRLRDVLVLPTGTGKTLTGFLVAIDAAYRAAESGARVSGSPEVLYVSPLRALAVDVHENLHIPLGEIREEAARLGLADPGLRVAVRTGDTPPAERAAMRKRAPDLLVTTRVSLPPPHRAVVAGLVARRAHGDRRRGPHLARTSTAATWP